MLRTASYGRDGRLRAVSTVLEDLSDPDPPAPPEIADGGEEIDVTGARLTVEEEAFADALVGAIVADLVAYPPNGAFARFVLRWFDWSDPAYMTLHALGPRTSTRARALGGRWSGATSTASSSARAVSPSSPRSRGPPRPSPRSTSWSRTSPSSTRRRRRSGRLCGGSRRRCRSVANRLLRGRRLALRGIRDVGLAGGVQLARGDRSAHRTGRTAAAGLTAAGPDDRRPLLMERATHSPKSSPSGTRSQTRWTTRTRRSEPDLTRS